MTAQTQILAQSFANHRRFPPLLYMVAFVVLAAEIVVRVIEVVRAPALANAWAMVVIIAVVLVAYYARINALVVQDRVIMLDMRLRLMRLLPSEQHTDIAKLTKGQLVALRFASDAELPALVQATIKESLSNTAIKQRISNWQADWQRV
jgi:Family of unknown function (DUF6526)